MCARQGSGWSGQGGTIAYRAFCLQVSGPGREGGRAAIQEKVPAVVTCPRAGRRRLFCSGSFPGIRVGRGAAPVPRRTWFPAQVRARFSAGRPLRGGGLCKRCITPLSAMDKPDARPMDKLCITVGLLYTAYPQPAHRLTHGSQGWGVIHAFTQPRRRSTASAQNRPYIRAKLSLFLPGEAPPSSGSRGKHLHRAGGAAPRAFRSALDPLPVKGVLEL